MSVRPVVSVRITIAWLLLAVTLDGSAATTPGSYPVFATGETLRTWCLGRGAVRASCLGNLAGVVEVLRTARATAGPGLPCLPQKLAGGQVRLLFLNHVHRLPSPASRAAAELVRDAMLAAFPCAEPPRQRPPGPGKERVSGTGLVPVDASTRTV